MKKTKKILSLLLVFAMIFTLAVPVFAEGETETPATLASWVGGTSVTNNGEADVLSDVTLSMKDNGEGLNAYGSLGVTTSTYGNLGVQPWYGTNSFSETNYGYMEFTAATTGYTSLKLTTILGNNGKAPASYVVEVSADGGETWTAATAKLTAPEGKVNKLENAVTSSVDIPEAANNQASVIFRIKQDVAAANANNAGNLYLYSLALTGTAKGTDPVDPTPTPEPGEMSGKTVILHSNDVHGAIAGYAKMAGLAAEYKAKGAEVIIADAGDYSQGTVAVSSNKGLNAVTMMNAAGYDVATLGNHEFDYGIAQLKTNLSEADFTNVCCNIVDENGDKLFEGSTVIEIGGVKVGFIGVNTPETQTKANPALIKGVKWLSGDDMIKAVNDEAAALAGKADVIVVLAHLGVDNESVPNRSVDLWNGVKDSVDFIIDGHSHTVMDKGPADEPIQSTGTAFANIGVVVIDNEAKTIESNKLVKVTDETASDKTVAAAAEAINEAIDKEYGAVFAKSEVLLNGEKATNEATGLRGNRTGETNLGDLITDAMLWKINEQGGVTVDADKIVALTNGGGIRATIKAGDITKKDINTVLPFGNTLAVVYVTGAELLEALEASTYCSPGAVGGFPQVSGIDFVISCNKPYDSNEETYPGSTYYGPKSIQRVTIIDINGQEFDPEETYAVVTNNFVAAGGDTYYAFAAADSQFDTGFTLDEVVMEYITEELKGVVGEEYADPAGRIMYNPFTDIDIAEDYYGIPAIFAYNAGITTGATETTFEPASSCTRGQFVTFLWRMNGKEAPADGYVNKFVDLKAGEYYVDAVAWAASNGIVLGTDETHFDPDAPITRAQAVTMLWRFDEETPAENGSDFTDLVKDEYYVDAVAWGAENGIVMGTSDTTFEPESICDRGMTVTFIFRYMVYFVAQDIPQQ